MPPGLLFMWHTKNACSNTNNNNNNNNNNIVVGDKENRVENDLTTDLPSGNNVLLAGDFNSHFTLWDKHALTDRRGLLMEEWLAENEMMPINNGEKTRVNRASGNWTTPDLTIIYNSMSNYTETKVLNELSSDHLPIMTLVNLDTEHHVKEYRIAWNWKKADWEKYKQEVTDKVT